MVHSKPKASDEDIRRSTKPLGLSLLQANCMVFETAPAPTVSHRICSHVTIKPAILRCNGSHRSAVREGKLPKIYRMLFQHSIESISWDEILKKRDSRHSSYNFL